MRNITPEFRPLLILAWVIVGISGFAGIMFLLNPASPAYLFRPGRDPFLLASAVAIEVFCLLSGIGVILRRKWGYYLFKSFLYTQFVAFPIGTIISYMTLSYMRKHEIKRHFGFIAPPTS